MNKARMNERMQKLERKYDKMVAALSGSRLANQKLATGYEVEVKTNQALMDAGRAMNLKNRRLAMQIELLEDILTTDQNKWLSRVWRLLTFGKAPALPITPEIECDQIVRKIKPLHTGLPVTNQDDIQPPTPKPPKAETAVSP